MNVRAGPPDASDPRPNPPRRCHVTTCRSTNTLEAHFCRSCGVVLDPHEAVAGGVPETYGMEIPLGQNRRLFNFLAWLTFVFVVAGVLVYLFVQFTASLRMALALVLFMLTYMAVMSRIVLGRQDERR